MIPDGERVTADWLREHEDVEAIVGRRVVGKTPSDTREPWIRVTMLNAQNEPSSSVEHLILYTLQLDCYASADGGQPEAKLLARTVREALVELQDAAVEDAVVTQVRFTGMLRLPDNDVDEPARERVVLTAMVRMH